MTQSLQAFQHHSTILHYCHQDTKITSKQIQSLRVFHTDMINVCRSWKYQFTKLLVTTEMKVIFAYYSREISLTNSKSMCTCDTMKQLMAQLLLKFSIPFSWILCADSIPIIQRSKGSNPKAQIQKQYKTKSDVIEKKSSSRFCSNTIPL